jgi:signal transduction histidine kinase
LDTNQELGDWGDVMLTAMAAMLLLASAIVFIFIAYQKRLMRQQKEHQQKENEYQQQLLRASLLSQEKERNRIGKDLHDEVGAVLTTAKLYFRHMNIEAGAAKFDELKAKTLGLMDETMTSIRRVSHDLRPVVLERLGLVEAIGNVADQVNDSGEIQLDFDASFEATLAKEDQLNWYRIVQELITNTLKHAQAKNIYLKLLEEDDTVCLLYKDDGIGLKAGSEMQAGLGMRNIESRLKLMHGHLEIIEKDKKGLHMKLTSKK